MHANNAGVTCLRTYRIVTGGRLSRAVALLALVAWTLSGVVCPMPDHGMDAVQAHEDAPTLGGQVQQHGKSPSHPESDLCCERLGNAHAIAQSIAAPTAEKLPGPSFAAANAAVPSLAAKVDPTRRLIPPTSGPPRSLPQRFASFWSHAPPADPS